MAAAEFGRAEPFALKLVNNSENRGFCEANNQGIAASTAPFIALLNNDAEASPGWLEALLGSFKDNQTGMAASKILVWEDPSRIDKVGHLIYLDGQNRGRGTGEIDRGQYDEPEEVLWPDGCAAMYRREMLDEVGGFDEDLFAYGDDAELGLRARIAGWRCRYEPAAVVRHHRGATLGVGSAKRVKLIERNRVLLAAKLFPWSLLWLNGAYYLARIAAGLVAAVRNEGEVRRFPGMGGKINLISGLIQGDLAAIRMLPRFLRKRREIEKIRKLSPKQLRNLLLRYRITLSELSRQAN
jgi:GT2 family glycosyltransferase